MKRVKLKPSREGLKVFNPKNKMDLKKDGELVDLSLYWRRLMKCGDVVEVQDSPKPKRVSKAIKSEDKKESEE